MIFRKGRGFLRTFSLQSNLAIKSHRPRLTPSDFLLLILVLFIQTGVSTLAFSNAQEGGNSIRIEAGGRTWLYPLDEPRSIQPLAEDGSCNIEISGGQVRVVASNCPQNICIQMGEIPDSGQWIACLPHKVFITVEQTDPEQIITVY